MLDPMLRRLLALDTHKIMRARESNESFTRLVAYKWASREGPFSAGRCNYRITPRGEHCARRVRERNPK